jgi:hypothetical protein
MTSIYTYYISIFSLIASVPRLILSLLNSIIDIKCIRTPHTPVISQLSCLHSFLTCPIPSLDPLNMF